MLILNPASVQIAGVEYSNVESCAIDRTPHKEVVEWSDNGAFAVFADFVLPMGRLVCASTELAGGDIEYGVVLGTAYGLWDDGRKTPGEPFGPGAIVEVARFLRGDVDNSTDTEVRAWIKKLGELIKEINIAMLTTIEADGALRSRPMMRLRQCYNAATPWWQDDL